ncbi:MAG: AMIN domain-containing protein [Desulfovibrio sp.]|jgi:hypothetical protein|nr:AMIN domain-containing protein [Desulfovibrio sp.]
MNKSLLALLLGVCLVGMGLLIYQEKQDGSRSPKPVEAAPEERRTPMPVPQGLSAVPMLPAAPAPATLPPLRSDAQSAAKSPPASRESAAKTENKTEGKIKPVEAKSVESGNGNAQTHAVKVDEAKANGDGSGNRQDVGKLPPREENAALMEASNAVSVPAAPSVPPVPQASVPNSAAKAANTLPRKPQQDAKLLVLTRDKGVTVRLTNSGPVRYQSMTLTGPDRIVVDVEGIVGLKAPGVPKNSLVRNVRLGKNNGKVRVVVDLAAKPASARFILSQDKDTLDIRLDQ